MEPEQQKLHRETCEDSRLPDVFPRGLTLEFSRERSESAATTR